MLLIISSNESFSSLTTPLKAIGLASTDWIHATVDLHAPVHQSDLVGYWEPGTNKLFWLVDAQRLSNRGYWK